MEWREDLHERNRKEKLETYLFAMKEDLSEWLVSLMNISVTAETFMNVLDNGIHLCRLANMIHRAAERYIKNNPNDAVRLPSFVATYKERGATYGSFVSRDNVANFIRWCRELGIPDVIIFESEDLVLHRYQKPVILSLLDVARRAAKFDVEPPDLVKMEEEIDEEIALEQQALEQQARALSSQLQQNDTHHQAVILKPKRTNDKPKTKNFIPKNLDTLVKETVQQCTCADKPFPMEKIADGKYKIGENRVLIFVRVMRNHVMVRVGGGWDTLENYIQKHDPCRTGGRSGSSCSTRHRPRCHTPNHHSGHTHDQDSVLHSASNTSIASSDSSSSSSSLSRLSPGSSQNNSLQSMVCVFGESGPRTEIVSPGDGQPSTSNSPLKRSETPVKPDKAKAAERSKSSSVRRRSLIDLAHGQKGKENGPSQTKKHSTDSSGKVPVSSTLSGDALRAKLREADLTFRRSKTSDAIVRRRNTDSPKSVVKRRGNGTLSREPSSDNLRAAKAKSTGARRKSVDERRRRSPQVQRKSTASPTPARRRLDLDNGPAVQKRSALRKDLNEDNLTFSRSFSADTIRRGLGSKSMSSISPARSPTAGSGVGQQASRIPMPLAAYGKLRGSKRTAGGSEGSQGTPNGRSGNPRNRNGEHMNNRCSHCGGECCICDEGFIDGDISRSTLRPKTLFVNGERQRKFEETSLTSRTNQNGHSSDAHTNCYHVNTKSACATGSQEHNRNNGYLDPYTNDNGDISWKDATDDSENQIHQDSSVEWKEVMTDILKYEEGRYSDKHL